MLINVARYTSIWSYQLCDWVAAPYTFQAQGTWYQGGYNFYLEGEMYWVNDY
jgi:hypothetical protein